MMKEMEEIEDEFKHVEPMMMTKDDWGSFHHTTTIFVEKSWVLIKFEIMIMSQVDSVELLIIIAVSTINSLVQYVWFFTTSVDMAVI